MKYPQATTYNEILGFPKSYSVTKDDEEMSLEQIKAEEERRLMEAKHEELEEKVFQAENPGKGFFRTVSEPSEAVLDQLIEEEVERFRSLLRKAKYDAATKTYGVSPETAHEHEESNLSENHLQRIARLAEHQFYSAERPDKDTLYETFELGVGYRGSRAAEEAKSFAKNILYDLSTQVFALKMCQMKSSHYHENNEGFLDDLLEVLERKRTEIELMPTAFETQYNFKGFTNQAPATLPCNNGIKGTTGGIAASWTKTTTTLKKKPRDKKLVQLKKVKEKLLNQNIK